MSTRKKQGSVGVHAHGCVSCGRRYEDACKVLGVYRGKNKYLAGPNDRCPSCRMGYDVFNPEAWYPRVCCQGARIVNKYEQGIYALAGDCLWFICLECSRTFPFRHPSEWSMYGPPPSRSQPVR